MFLTGLFLFVWMIVLADAVPIEYRNTSPGYSWKWDFDWEAGVKDGGRLGEEPWPWPAKVTGSSLMLPLNQPLVYDGFEITYRGILASGDFRLDVVIRTLDAGIAYPRDFAELEARRGFVIADRSFSLEKITPHYLRLHAKSK
jgi:hypothetical protein